MKYCLKLLVGIMFPFIIQSLCYAGDFRKGNWGMEVEEVKALEGNFEFSAENQMLGGHVEVAVLDAYAIYQFINNILVKGSYVITETYFSNQSYLGAFEKLEDLLTKKYGPTDKRKTKWINDLYKDSPQNYGMAIGMGHLNIITVWKEGSTEIALYITGDNLEVSLFISYLGVAYRELINKTKEKENLEDL